MGVAHGIGKSAGLRAMFGGLKGGAGGMARSAGGMLGRAGGVGAGLLGASYFGGMAGKEDATGAEKTTGVLGSMASGALAGAMFGPWGAAIGAGIGGLYGGYQALKKRAFGGPMDANNSYLVHKDEIITPGTKSTVTAKSEVKDILNTERLEKQLIAISAGIVAGNKIHSSSLLE